MKRRINAKWIMTVLPLATACGLLSSGKSFERMLQVTVPDDVPHVSVTQLRDSTSPDVMLLDSRAREEYEVSHLENAIWVGESEVPDSIMDGLNPQDSLVVYCSVGARSASVTAELRQKGFKNAYNLYGGVFGWIRQGGTVVDSTNQPVSRVHPYNKIWGQWVSGAEKAYE